MNCAAMKAAAPLGAMPANLSEIDDGGGGNARKTVTAVHSTPHSPTGRESLG